MSRVVNLRTVRKQRSRAADRERAAERAAKSGEDAAEAARRQADAALAARRHDGHRRGDADE